MTERGQAVDTENTGVDAEPDPRRWRALAVCLVGGFMVLLDVSIVNVALPSISTGLKASADQLQWVVSGYALTFGLLLVPSGRLGDMRGRRGVFVLALALFTLASIGCGLSQNGLWLVIARLLQGLAGGLLTPQIAALIQELFRGAERGRAFGLFGAMVGISTALGPVVGGLLINLAGADHGWRFVFLVNVPIAIVAIPFAWKFIPPQEFGQRQPHDFDLVGTVLLGGAVVGILLPFVQSQQWPGAAKWLILIPALLLGVAFLLWERRYRRSGREPLADFELFTRPSYSFGTGLITLYFAGFTPVFFVITLYFQQGLGYSALVAGLATTPFAIGSGIAAWRSGRVVQTLGRKLILAGLALVLLGLAGCWLAVQLAPTSHTGAFTALPLLIAGVGSGLVISPNQTLTLAEVPVREAGTASGLLQTGQRIGSAVGIAAGGAVFFAATAGRGFPSAFQMGLLVAGGFIAASLAVAITEYVRIDRQPAAG